MCPSGPEIKSNHILKLTKYEDRKEKEREEKKERKGKILMEASYIQAEGPPLQLYISSAV